MEISEENAWFYIRDHQQHGPVGLFELEKLFEHGVLAAETFVWTKEMNQWQMVKSLDLFPDGVFKSKQIEDSPENLASVWQEQEKDTYPNGRPLVRYLARFFDLSLFSLFFIIIVSNFSPDFITQSSGFLTFMLSLIIYIFVEAIIISIFGNTLGRAILNERLLTVDGERLDFPTALKRGIFVSAAGMGFGIPIINFICFCFSFFDLRRNGKSTWDQQIGTVVLYGKVNISRLLIVSLPPIGLLIAGLTIS